MFGPRKMTLSDLQKLVSQGESSTIEFKKSTAQLSASFETLCGFLNEKGGTVLIGVTDKGKIIGQDISDKTQKDIANEISKLEPSAFVDVEYISLNENSPLKIIGVKNVKNDQI